MKSPLVESTGCAPGQTWTQSYSYDTVNRLSGVSETGGSGWSQSFGYDTWGNRWVSGYTTLVPQPQTPVTSSWYNTSNNRLKSAGYDTAGNQATLGSVAMSYDGESRMTTAVKSIVGQSWTTQYKYDGDGRRVRKIDAASATTVFVYDAMGNLAAEYFSGSVTGTRGVDYLTADHLGSTRMIANSSGTVLAKRDYQPFGEEVPSGIGARPEVYGHQTEIRQQFTGKERDAETGLDYFETRYLSSAQGRFTSPDSYNIIHEMNKGGTEGERQQILASYLSNPRVWNKYAYVLNNPLKHTDPDGRRELTQEYDERLKRLQQYAQQSGNRSVQAAARAAATEIKAAIAAVPEGQADPTNLSATFFAIDNLGNTNFGYNCSVNNGVTVAVGPGDWKCNIFYASAYAQGAGVGFGGRGVPTNSTFVGGLFGRKCPPVANDLANPGLAIPNFAVVARPSVGDIAAFPHPGGIGYSSIYVGGGAVIYAGERDVEINTVSGTRSALNSPAVTYRRYKP